MPRGMHKSGRLRKIFVKTPGSKVNIHYRLRKPSKAICSDCKKNLVGVPNKTPGKLTSLPKTAKRPERPYGGVLCSACTRKVMKQKARSEK